MIWPPCSCSYFLRTSSFVGSRTQSRRRSTVIGRMTFLYSLGWYGPRNRSATDQMKLTFSLKLFVRFPSNVLSYYFTDVKVSETNSCAVSSFDTDYTGNMFQVASCGVFNLKSKNSENKHDLEIIRILLAKLEPRRLTDLTALALPVVFRDLGFGWRINSKVPGSEIAISRQELADEVLDLLTSMRDTCK